MRSAILAARTVLRHGLRHHILFALFDWVSTQVFLRFHKNEPAHFSILFLNSLAHLQHNQWPANDEYPDDFLECFRLMDDLLGDVFRAFEGEPIIVANAFSQENCVAANEYLYRQKEPMDFLQAAGIEPESVEQLMTNDAHVFFQNKEKAAEATRVLNDARINGSRVFQAEQSGVRVFYQVANWEPSPEDAFLEINRKQLLFSQYFDKIVRRTGSHIQEGVVFYKGLQIPEQLKNHGLFDVVLQCFVPDAGKEK